MQVIENDAPEMNEWRAVNAVADAVDRLRLEVLDDLYALALAQHHRPVNAEEEHLDYGRGFLTVNAKQSEIESWHGRRLHPKRRPQVTRTRPAGVATLSAGTLRRAPTPFRPVRSEGHAAVHRAPLLVRPLTAFPP